MPLAAVRGCPGLNRVQFSRMTGLVSTFETTITQNLLFDFWQLARSVSLDIALLESINEKAHGNDLEILVSDTSGRYRLLPTQAKILYDNHHYTAIEHGKPANFQIEKLIAYATKKKGIPIYLFYNFYPGEVFNKAIGKISFEPIELLGCSLADARKIKDRFFSVGQQAGFHTIPSFTDIHPSLAVPWHHLICPTSSSLLTQTLSDPGSEVTLYSYEEIMNDQSWINLTPARGIGYITPDAVRQKFTTYADQGGFAPKYRIVLSARRSERRIIRQLS
jgi:hypothetical protein